MATQIEELLGQLHEMVSEARGVPFTQNFMLDRDAVLDLIEDIKENLPKDLQQAQDIISRRAELLEKAGKDADTIKKNAEATAESMIAQDEIVRATREKAKEIIQTAESKAREIKRAANEYADDTLRRLEEIISDTLNSAKVSRQRFRDVMSKTAAMPTGSQSAIAPK